MCFHGSVGFAIPPSTPMLRPSSLFLFSRMTSVPTLIFSGVGSFGNSRTEINGIHAWATSRFYMQSFNRAPYGPTEYAGDAREHTANSCFPLDEPASPSFPILVGTAHVPLPTFGHSPIVRQLLNAYGVFTSNDDAPNTPKTDAESLSLRRGRSLSTGVVPFLNQQMRSLPRGSLCFTQHSVMDGLAGGRRIHRQ